MRSADDQALTMKYIGCQCTGAHESSMNIVSPEVLALAFTRSKLGMTVDVPRAIL